MFVTPNFKVETDPDITMLSFSENEEGMVDEFYVVEGRDIVKAKLGKPNKLLLTELSGGQGMYLFSDGRIEMDYLEN